MNFKEIVDLSLNMIDETDYDEQIESIVKNAINKAYADLCKKDVRLNRAFVPVINGIMTLPEDIIGIVKSTPELTYKDRVYGNSVVTDKTGVIEILYKYMREPLSGDEDEPELHLSLQYALATYACYRYFEHRKKIDVAQSFLDNYNREVYEFEYDNKCYTETIVMEDV